MFDRYERYRGYSNSCVPFNLKLNQSIKFKRDGKTVNGKIASMIHNGCVEAISNGKRVLLSYVCGNALNATWNQIQ